MTIAFFFINLATSLVAFNKYLKSGVFSLFIGVGTVMINILQFSRNFLSLVNFKFFDFFILCLEISFVLSIQFFNS